jgi:drug/metabolite transporter (DMT)-like permease
MKFSPYLLLIFTNLFFAFNIIVGKLLTEVIPPITLAFLRWLGSFLILLPFSWRKIWTYRRAFLSRWRIILALGFIGYSLTTILAYESVYHSTAINISFINAFVPIMVAIMGFLLYREPVTRLQSLGFFISLFGVIWVVFQGNWINILRLKLNPGDLFMIINVTTWPIFPVLYKHKASDLPRLAMLSWMILAGLSITVFPLIIENTILHGTWVYQVRWVHLLGLLGLCLFPSVLANFFQNTALKYVSTNTVGVFQSLIPAFASIFAVIFLNEKLYLYHIFGGLLIFIGLHLVIRYGPKETLR